MGVGRGSPSAKLTYRDYIALPDPADARRYEVLDGDLVMTPSPLIRHQDVSLNLERILDRYVRRHRAGRLYHAPVDVILHPNTIVVPDIAFVAAGRAGIVGERAIEGAPDLLIEILSPSSARRDRVVKARLYARFGVHHYWLVDPRAETLSMLESRGTSFGPARLSQGSDKATSPLFPRLVIDLAKLWPEPPAR